MCTIEFTQGGGPQQPSCASYDCETQAVQCQECLVKEHSITNCSFWCMVCQFFGVPFDQQTCTPASTMPQGIPAPIIWTTQQIDDLINAPGVNCKSNSVRMLSVPFTTINNLEINITIANHLNGTHFDQSISLFQGLVNLYPDHFFNFYQAKIPLTDSNGNQMFDTPPIDGVLFNITDSNNVPVYYCDISGMNP